MHLTGWNPWGISVQPDPLLLNVLREPVSTVLLKLEDWDVLIRQARQFDLLGRLSVLLEECELLEAVPAQPREHLLSGHVAAQRHKLAVHAEVAHIRKALQPIGVPIILLKGAAYAIAKLPPASGRFFSDIDILVPKESVNAVEAALLMNGWIATHPDAYDQHYYRTWMHELPPMQHVKRMTVIDVHHAIVPQTSPVQPDPVKLRMAARPVEGFADLLVLGPVDMVLHSAVHLFHDGEFDHGLRDLVDLDALLRHFGCRREFWVELIQRAEEMQLSRPLFYALRYAERFLKTPVPASTRQAADAAKPNLLLLRCMDAIFQRGILGVVPWNPEHSASLSHFLLYIRANALRMPPLLLARHLFHKAVLSPSRE